MRADEIAPGELVVWIEGDGPEGGAKLEVKVEEAAPHRIARIGMELGRLRPA